VRDEMADDEGEHDEAAEPGAACLALPARPLTSHCLVAGGVWPVTGSDEGVQAQMIPPAIHLTDHRSIDQAGFRPDWPPARLKHGTVHA